MKKRKMTINEYKNPLGSYTVTINNVRYHKNFSENIVNLIKEFIDDSELFFGFCRTDGVNLTLKRQKELEKEIPALFRKHGEIKNQSEYLSVAKINVIDEIYDYIPSIFDYYFETVMFNSTVSWDFFKQYHCDYQKHRYDDLVINGFAEVLFFYFDSGDFSICYNPEKYNPKEVRDIIDNFFVL